MLPLAWLRQEEEPASRWTAGNILPQWPQCMRVFFSIYRFLRLLLDISIYKKDMYCPTLLKWPTTAATISPTIWWRWWRTGAIPSPQQPRGRLLGIWRYSASPPLQLSTHPPHPSQTGKIVLRLAGLCSRLEIGWTEQFPREIYWRSTRPSHFFRQWKIPVDSHS